MALLRHGGRLCTLIFSRLCTLIFSRLCTLTSSTLSDMLRNIGNSRAIEAVNFFSLVHPGALFLDLGSLLHPGHLLQVRKCDLYEVTSVMPSMLSVLSVSSCSKDLLLQSSTRSRCHALKNFSWIFDTLPMSRSKELLLQSSTRSRCHAPKNFSCNIRHAPDVML